MRKLVCCLVLASLFYAVSPIALAADEAPAPVVYTGVASWYGADFHGKPTASGEAYDKEAMTAAHRSLPFGTLLLVRSLDTQASVVVRVNDRGPFVEGRDLDLSEAAARILGMTLTGTARVTYSVISPAEAAAFGQPAPRPAGPPAVSQGTAQLSDRKLCRIQVASFRDRKNALGVIERLGLSGLKAELEEAKPYWRVVFPAVPAAEVEALAARLRSLSYTGLLITWY
jgi:rare lipoprotein A (peptidoglycan hydrolase)